MTAGRFKKEAKKHILENKQEYLNFGIKFNVTGKRDVKKKAKGLKQLKNDQRFQVNSDFFRKKPQGKK